MQHKSISTSSANAFNAENADVLPLQFNGIATVVYI